MDPDRAQLEARLFHLSDLMTPHAVRAAAALGIADKLVEGPRSTEDLAEACGVQAGPLRRLLRYLASLDIFYETEPGVFALAPLADFLRAGVEASLHSEFVGVHGQRVAAAAADIVYSFGRDDRPTRPSSASRSSTSAFATATRRSRSRRR